MSNFSAERMAEHTLSALQEHGCPLADGLTKSELAAAEDRVSCAFPPDLAALLQTALPMGSRYPNWREPDGDSLQGFIEAPIDRIVFDIHNTNFWHPDWPVRPGDDEEAEAVARSAFAKVPPVIPLFSHRYLVSLPVRAGNPVLSIYQTDVIVYGTDLANWADHEFRDGRTNLEPIAELEFWDHLLYEAM